jgi:hypothetical protein
VVAVSKLVFENLSGRLTARYRFMAKNFAKKVHKNCRLLNFPYICCCLLIKKGGGTWPGDALATVL